MVHDGCWSTVICSARERTELGNTSDTGWVLGCRLSIGHRGDHATDAETTPRFDRRLWLEWNDHEQHAQSLIERKPCAGGVGARCMLFEGHGGVHWYAPTNGYLTAAGTGRRRLEESEPPGRSNIATVEHAHDDGGHHDVGHAVDDHSTDAHAAAHDVIESGAHRVDESERDLDDHFDTSSIADLAEIPNLRSRAVRGHSSTDRLESMFPSAPDDVATFTDAREMSVTDALDGVVAALGQLAEALRRAESDREGRERA